MSIWQRLVALFRLSFSSVFGSAPRLPAPETDAAEQEEQSPLPFELDSQKLDYVRYRRQVLDWRDDFAVRLLADGNESFRRFSAYVENEADKVGLFRYLFAKPAAEVLRDEFLTIVRSPLANLARAAEAQLRQAIQRSAYSQSLFLSLTVEEVDPLLGVLGDLRFRTTNQKELLSKLNGLVFGKDGITDSYIQRAQSVSQSLLRATEAKP